MGRNESEDKNLDEALNRQESEREYSRESYQPTKDELNDDDPPTEDSSSDDS